MSGCPGAPPPTPLTRGISPDDHAWFPIVDGTPHAFGLAAADGPISCESCHVATAPFSEFTCIGCHEHRQGGMDADGSQGMDAVHAGNALYAYASTACLSCHATGTAGELPRAEHTPHFPIDVGTKHENTTCAGCHTSAEDRGAVTCTGCHTDQNRDGLLDHDVSAMLAVHGPDMGVLGYTWDTAACRSCHARGETPGVVDHSAQFPIGAESVHAANTCIDCHANRQDHQQLDCVNCHTPKDDGDGAGARDVHGQPRMEQKHTGVTGYGWDSQACYACHQSAQVPGGMDHERYFPIGAGSKHALNASIGNPKVLVECATCHQNPVDNRAVTCVGCHEHSETVMATTHTTFPGYAWDSNSCVFCHLGGQRNLEHPFFPVGAGDVHAKDNTATPAIDGITCNACHASQVDRTQLACTSCHQHTPEQEAVDHGNAMSLHGYRYDSAACFACHATSQVPGTFDHEPIYPLLPPSGKTAHQALQCADCHTNREDRKGSLACTTCHTPTSAADNRDVHGEARLAEVHGAIPGYVFSPQSCVGCHTDGTAAAAAQNLNHTWFPIGAGKTHALDGNGGQLTCIDCHTTPGDFSPATQDCLSCHLTTDDADGNGPRAVHGEPRLQQKHVGVDGFVYSTTECLGCHPNGEPAGNFEHTGFPIAAGAKHAGVSCTQCHTGTAPKTDRTALGCASCHAANVNVNPTVAQIHNGVPGFVNASPSCLTCHPNAEPVGPMDHAAYFPIGVGSVHASAAYMAKVSDTQTQCSACHTSRTDRAADRCMECHASVPPVPTTAHTSVRGFVNASVNCKECHAEATVMRLTQHPKRGNKSWTSHEGATCKNCHIDQAECLTRPTCANNNAGGKVNPEAKAAYRLDKPWALNFEMSGCIGCHEHKKSTVDSKHTDVGGYTSYGVPKCSSCH